MMPLISSKKRSPQAAFEDETLPPTRIYNQKRLRSKRATEKPSWVSEESQSIRLDATVEKAPVDVLWPGLEGGYVGRQVRDVLQAGARGGGDFTVLCFLGCSLEPLEELSRISSFLQDQNAFTFGVSPTRLPHIFPFPMIHDYTLTLTHALGLLHPLGGGRQALDAIVVLDHNSRKRMILPVGWELRPMPGGCNDESGNGAVSAVKRCVEGIEWLTQAADECVEDVVMAMDDEMPTFDF